MTTTAITIVDDVRGTWRRVYVGREVVLEGDPRRLSARMYLEKVEDALRVNPGTIKLRFVTVDDFNMLEEAGGVARA